MDNNFFGKRALVVGSGISGKGAALALKKRGALIYFYENDFPENIDLIVMSPGVREDKFVEYAKSKNIDLIGEIELGFLLDPAPIVAITGTNGKTTVAMLAGDMLARSGFNTNVCGNIGKSYAAGAVEPHEITVLEVSSFQLLTVKQFAPQVAVITNITADHLDRHGNMQSYTEAKMNICRRQSPNGYLITTREIATPARENTKSKIITLGDELVCRDGALYVFGKKVVGIEELARREEHNIADALFASAAAIVSGASYESVRETLVNFKVADHRLKFVGNFGGKNYFNDSKGTNIGASLAAAASMTSSTALIAGGRGKGYEFDELFSGLPSNVKYVIGIGEVKDKLMEAAKRCGYENFILSADLEEAVEISKKLDVQNVLLSPAAASFDRYNGYDERGKHFERLIRG